MKKYPLLEPVKVFINRLQWTNFLLFCVKFFGLLPAYACKICLKQNKISSISLDHENFNRLLLTLSLVSFIPFFSLAQPDTVRVGIFINDIYDINFSENSFSAEYWVWFNYRDSSLNPLETLEMASAKEVESSLEFSEKKGDLYWAGKKIRAVVKKNWDVLYFPFDSQVMSLELEESNQDASELVFIADNQNSKLGDSLHMSNWEVESFRTQNRIAEYETTYGDPTLQGSSQYARVAFHIAIKRKSWGLFFSIFTGLYVAFLISGMVFFIDPVDIDPRFGLSVGGLFAAVGNKYIVDSILPQTTTFTLVDKLHVVTYIFLLLCIICSVISLRMWKNGFPERSRRFDRRMYWGILICYISANLLLVGRFV